MNSIKTIALSILLALVLLSCGQKPQEKKRVTKDMLLEMNKKLVGAESEIIEKYIEDKGLQMETSKTGYYYSVSNASSGDTIRINDHVILAYTTSLLDGTICYSSATEGLMNFTVGKAQVEAGLEQFVQQLGPGSIAKLILPPYLAHGVAGDGNKIPKLAILVMDIEVVEVHRVPAE
ncbi:FKBP-type peptidyl-prolyl cis-trans isomerase [Carboxylicivirga sp. RSCT41]|uniref:FKBP-type peptidyl-prolyl cis-trans isomerase n=1 Tax=Carboxylicivirga agarovorans TaxID=3417570 RepID=UPI003D33242B